MRELDLWSNQFGDKGADAFGAAMRHGLEVEVLNLGDNSICVVTQLAKGVAVCCRLRSLNLRQNYISDRSAQLLFEALETSPTLRNLNLWTNSIGSDAAPGSCRLPPRGQA